MDHREGFPAHCGGENHVSPSLALLWEASSQADPTLIPLKSSKKISAISETLNLNHLK